MKPKQIEIIRIGWLAAMVTAAFIQFQARALDYTMTVNNIAEMQSLDPTTLGNTNGFLVLGYYTPGDRGGGVFQWQPASTMTPDGGHYIMSSNLYFNNPSAPGRWVRMLNGETANVKMWGAKGDNVNDDTTAIQNALNACWEFGWTQEILLPTGEYKVTNTLIFWNVTHIRGEGPQNTWVVMPKGVQHDIFCSINAYRALYPTNVAVDWDHGLLFENMAVAFAGDPVNNPVSDLDRNTNNSCLIIANPGEAMEIRNCFFQNGGYGIRCLGAGAPGLRVTDVTSMYPYVGGIDVEPLPGQTSTGINTFVYKGISGDYQWNDAGAQPGGASLIRFYNADVVATIESIKAEGQWGGGVVQYGSAVGSGSVSIDNASCNMGANSTNFVFPPDFLVINQPYAPHVTLHNISLYSERYLINDLVSGRHVESDSHIYDGNYQITATTPLNYYSSPTPQGSPSISKLEIGQTTFSYLYATNAGWYRVMSTHWHNYQDKLTISSRAPSQSYEFAFGSGNGGNWINVLRAPAAGQNVITQARISSYNDNTGSTINFDVYVGNPFPANPYRAIETRLAFACDINGSDQNDELTALPLLGSINPVATLFPPGASSTSSTMVNADMSSMIIGNLTTPALENIALGQQSLSADTTGFANDAIGVQSLQNNISGIFNVANGISSLAGNISGSYNVADGADALYSNTNGNWNTAVGQHSLSSNTSGGANTAVGLNAMYSNTTGGFNCALGISALNDNTTAGNNTAVGNSALFNNTVGNNNTALGNHSGYNITTGSYNIDIGNYGLASDNATIRIGDTNQTDTYLAGVLHLSTNVIVGGSLTIGTTQVSPFAAGLLGSLSASNLLATIGLPVMPSTILTNYESQPVILASSLTVNGTISEAAGQAYLYNGINMAYALTGLNDYFFGGAGNFTLSGIENIGVGPQALASNTNGFANVAIGFQALQGNTSGFFNNAIGYNALLANVTGMHNVAEGAQALQFNTNGQANIAVGVSSLEYNTSGGWNNSVGDNAMYSNTAGSYNCALGATALWANTTGANNTAIGNQALENSAAGNFNTALGSQAGLNISNGWYNIDIGNNGLASDNGIIRLGGNNQTDTYLAGVVHAPNNLMVGGALTISNGVATTISNTLPAVAVSISSSPYFWTNTTPVNLAVYLNRLTGSVGYNGALLFGPVSNAPITIILQPNAFLSITNTVGTAVLNWHPL